MKNDRVRRSYEQCSFSYVDECNRKGTVSVHSAGKPNIIMLMVDFPAKNQDGVVFVADLSAVAKVNRNGSLF